MFPVDSNILLIDDSLAVRALVREQLAKIGYTQVYEAQNGKDALDKLEGYSKDGLPIHLFIADWRMPELDGIDLLVRLKNHSQYRLIPFLMVAAEHDMDNIAKAVSLGASDFLIKPFDEERLCEKLTAIWNRMSLSK